MFEHRVEGRAERVPIVSMHDRKPIASGSCEAVRRQAKLVADIWPGNNAVTQNVPIPNGIAGAGNGKRLPFHVAEQALMKAASRECMLHDRKADQQDDEDQPAAKRRLYNVIVQHAGGRHPRTGKPDKHHQPTRYQHDSAVVALKAEIDNQPDSSDSGRREGEASNAGRHRRINN